MRYTLLILVLFFTLNCEERIDIDLPTTEPRLVIDASLNWFKDTTGNEQSIKLTLTAPYFTENVPTANNAIVVVTDSNNNSFNFTEENQTGIYTTTSFQPVLNETYTITITYNNEIYTGTETLLPVASVDFVEQNLNGGFSGEETEIKAFYTDPLGVENYYFFEFINNFMPLPSLEVYNDEFTDGNQIFAFYTEEDLDSGEPLTINNYGVSKRFYEYMFILLQQSSEENGDPFETQPTTVRGNCINLTNPDNYPLGYFRVSQADTFNYIVE